MTEAEIAEFSGLKNGLHANLAETSAVMAINPDLVDIDKANAEFPPFPEFTVPTGPVHTAFFFTNPGSVHAATKSGTWGDARGSNAAAGERYIEAGVRSTLAVLDNIAQNLRRDAPPADRERSEPVEPAEPVEPERLRSCAAVRAHLTPQPRRPYG